MIAPAFTPAFTPPYHGEVRGGRVWDSALQRWEPWERELTPASRYKRQHRARARAKGVCPVCCSRPADPGYKTCATCKKRNKRRWAETERLAALARKAGLDRIA